MPKDNYRTAGVHRINVFDVLSGILLAVLTVLCVLPFYMMFINATHENAVINSSFQLLPGNYLARNYANMTSMINVWQGLRNSAFISVCVTVGAVYISALTAYGFAKYKFRLNGLLFWVLLATMMLPAQLGIVGVFQLMSSLNLLDNHFSLILPALVNASAVFFIRQYIEAYFPDALMESALIDGCSDAGIFHRIALPIISPALATQAIFLFVGSWNNFINPLVLLFTQEKFPMPLMVQQTSGTFNRDMGVIYLGVSISVLPILVAFAFFSRWILGGLTVGAVKG